MFSGTLNSSLPPPPKVQIWIRGQEKNDIFVSSTEKRKEEKQVGRGEKERRERKEERGEERRKERKKNRQKRNVNVFLG